MRYGTNAPFSSSLHLTLGMEKGTKKIKESNCNFPVLIKAYPTYYFVKVLELATFAADG